jgi:hypothetical protein
LLDEIIFYPQQAVCLQDGNFRSWYY